MNDKKHVPDIMEVITDLSNDEVRTPPKTANLILDLLPKEVWSNSSYRWLDPGVKSGVFLREAAKRLMIGLTEEIPDEQQRITHILTNQLFGIAVTELSGLMSRRALYCSKHANSSDAVVQFLDEQGNIWHNRTSHLFINGRCSECKAGQKEFGTLDDENHAYGFLHENGRREISEVMDMNFDIVVGNPPYQMSVPGSSDIPLYQHFVSQAKKLNPRYISFVIPARWYAGGKGLDEFRAEMLSDRRIRKLHDYMKAQDVFPTMNADFEGGVCYFLWDRDNPGLCESFICDQTTQLGPFIRELDELDVFVRDIRALDILRKIQKKSTTTVDSLTTGQTPFGFYSNFKNYEDKESSNSVKLFVNIGGKRSERWVKRDQIVKGKDLVDQWKLLIPEAYGERGAVPAMVLGPMLISPPGTCCTQTYLAFGPFDDETEVLNFQSFMQTKLARFLISLRKISQHAGRMTYSFVPVMDYSQKWTDLKLQQHFGLETDEISYIDSVIREFPTS